MKETITLLDVLKRSLGETKTKEDIISDGKVMARLLANEDFQRYQNILLEAQIALMRRFGLAAREDLPIMQGAIVQLDLVSKLPQKKYEDASRIVEQESNEVKR